MRWLSTGWVGSHLLGFSFPAPFCLATSSRPSLLILSWRDRYVRAHLRRPFDLPARLIDSTRRCISAADPITLHDPAPRRPPLYSPAPLEDHHAIPEHPCSAPSRTTPDSSSSSRLDRPLALTARVLVLPKFFRSALPVQPAPGPSPAHTFHGQLRPHRHGPLRPHGLRLTTGPSPVPTPLCLALLRRPLW